MVFLDPKNLGYEPFWEKWLSERESPFEQEELSRLFKKYIHSCLAFVCEGIMDGRQGEKPESSIPMTALNMVISVFWLSQEFRLFGDGCVWSISNSILAFKRLICHFK